MDNAFLKVSHGSDPDRKTGGFDMAWAIFSMLFLAIGGVVYGAAALIWFALTILANWLMFMKAGEAGWKSIIPVYNTYTAYKIAWTPNMFWIYFIFTVLESIFSSISGGDFWSFSGFLEVCADW